MRRAAVSLLLAAVALAGCHRESALAIAYRAVGDDNQALRQAFNDDVDKVRVIMLVAPS
jgi:hypothetical protein